MATESEQLSLLRKLWLDREKMHAILDSYWDKDDYTDRLCEELAPNADDDTLLAQLREVALDNKWAWHTPAGFTVRSQADTKDNTENGN